MLAVRNQVFSFASAVLVAQVGSLCGPTIMRHCLWAGDPLPAITVPSGGLGQSTMLGLKSSSVSAFLFAKYIISFFASYVFLGCTF